jgi:uncharacterized protein
MNDLPVPPSQAGPPRWQPITAIDRRILGVLVEKAKTVPSAYPMSLSAIVTGANQKNNRFPVMQLEPDQAEESLERLRGLGGVGLIQGYGRVAKYRHYLYEWLGVDKVELAVMTELLLRGAQTEGELRARAARMEPIADLTALRTILVSLESKKLILSLSPEGRGHVLTHALYNPRELEHLRAQYAAGAFAAPAEPEESRGPASPRLAAAGLGQSESRGHVSPRLAGGSDDALRGEISELRAQVAQLRGDLDEMAATVRQTDDEVRRLKSELGV